MIDFKNYVVDVQAKNGAPAVSDTVLRVVASALRIAIALEAEGANLQMITLNVSAEDVDYFEAATDGYELLEDNTFSSGEDSAEARIDRFYEVAKAAASVSSLLAADESIEGTCVLESVLYGASTYHYSGPTEV